MGAAVTTGFTLVPVEVWELGVCFTWGGVAFFELRFLGAAFLAVPGVTLVTGFAAGGGVLPAAGLVWACVTEDTPIRAKMTKVL